MKRIVTTGKPGYGTSKESVQLFLNLLKKNDSTKIPIHISASYSKYVYISCLLLFVIEKKNGLLMEEMNEQVIEIYICMLTDFFCTTLLFFSFFF